MLAILVAKSYLILDDLVVGDRFVPSEADRIERVEEGGPSRWPNKSSRATHAVFRHIMSHGAQAR
jgi:hypothetical protein